MRTIFVKTRWYYQSYTDFWKLVELSDFQTCFVDEMDLYAEDTAYIVAPMNGEWRPFVDERPNRKAKLILWNLERPGGSGSVAKYASDNLELVGKYLDKVVVSDRSLANLCGLDYIIMGGHPDLGIPGMPSLKKYDLIHLSCYSNARSWMFDTPDHPKTMLLGNLTVARNGWGQDRHWSLQESRFMLNVHQDGFPFIEPLRFILAAEYGLPVISEASNSFFPYENFVIPLYDVKNGYYSYGDSVYMHGINFRNYVNRHFPFRRCVEDYVNTL